MEGQTDQHERTSRIARRVRWPRRLILLEQEARGRDDILVENPILSFTRGYIFGEKPSPGGYQTHPSDEGSLEDAQELHFEDFDKVATRLEGYVYPPTHNRSTITTIFVDSTSGGIMRSVVTRLLATGVLPKTSTTPPDLEEEGLSCEAFDNIGNMDRRINETSIQ